jgi:hypothetical protein
MRINESHTGYLPVSVALCHSAHTGHPVAVYSPERKHGFGNAPFSDVKIVIHSLGQAPGGAPDGNGLRPGLLRGERLTVERNAGNGYVLFDAIQKERIHSRG